MSMMRPFTPRTQAYVRRRVLADMTAVIRVLRVLNPALDPISLIMTSGTQEVIYSGRARIRAVSGGGSIIAGEEVIATSNTSISIPFDAALPRVDDVVLVDTFGSDIEQVTRAFLVRDVDGGGLLRAMRTMTCTAYQGSRWWDND